MGPKGRLLVPRLLVYSCVIHSIHRMLSGEFDIYEKKQLSPYEILARQVAFKFKKVYKMGPGEYV